MANARQSENERKQRVCVLINKAKEVSTKFKSGATITNQYQQRRNLVQYSSTESQAVIKSFTAKAFKRQITDFS